MASNKTILLPLLLLLLAAAPPAALAVFDVVQMLADKPTYGAFSRILAQSKVAEEVNRLRSASLLVVPTKETPPLLALPVDKQRQALANHVLLNYFDPIKLDEMKARTAILPTMLSATDKALGVLNYTRADDGQMYFGAPGAACVAKLVKVVAARPYSISIMEISEPILPPGPAVPPPGGRRARGGKGKIKPSTTGLDDSKMAAASGEAAGSDVPASPGSSTAAAPGAALQ